MTAAACTRSPGAELLSAYLDGELPAGERRRVERHVAQCPGCRAELEGLRRVVRRLGALEAQAPPPVLASAVARRLALEARPARRLERVEAALRRLPADPAILLSFGLVTALAAILLLFVAGLAERPASRTAAPAATAAGQPERADRAAGDDSLRVLSAVVAGRHFDRQGALWVERGVQVDGVRRLDAESPEARALLSGSPRLADLFAGSGGVVLVVPGGDGTPEAVRIDPAAH